VKGERGTEARVAVGGAVARNSEVTEKATRRRFTAEYKLGVLRSVDACRAAGEIGALLRREGLYSSHLNAWRQQRKRGLLGAMAAKKRGRKPEANEPLVKEVTKLRREKAALERKLKQAELIIEIQKKASEMLGIPLATLEDDESDS